MNWLTWLFSPHSGSRHPLRTTILAIVGICLICQAYSSLVLSPATARSGVVGAGHYSWLAIAGYLLAIALGLGLIWVIVREGSAVLGTIGAALGTFFSSEPVKTALKCIVLFSLLALLGWFWLGWLPSHMTGTTGVDLRITTAIAVVLAVFAIPAMWYFFADLGIPGTYENISKACKILGGVAIAYLLWSYVFGSPYNYFDFQTGKSTFWVDEKVERVYYHSGFDQLTGKELREGKLEDVTGHESKSPTKEPSGHLPTRPTRNYTLLAIVLLGFGLAPKVKDNATTIALVAGSLTLLCIVAIKWQEIGQVANPILTTYGNWIAAIGILTLVLIGLKPTVEKNWNAVALWSGIALFIAIITTQWKSISPALAPIIEGYGSQLALAGVVTLLAIGLKPTVEKHWAAFALLIALGILTFMHAGKLGNFFDEWNRVYAQERAREWKTCHLSWQVTKSSRVNGSKVNRNAFDGEYRDVDGFFQIRFVHLRYTGAITLKHADATTLSGTWWLRGEGKDGGTGDVTLTINADGSLDGPERDVSGEEARLHVTF